MVLEKEVVMDAKFFESVFAIGVVLAAGALCVAVCYAAYRIKKEGRI